MKISFASVLTFLCVNIFSQENPGYKTVYLEDLCSHIRENPNIVLIDVRSQGEFDDTSYAGNLNVGRFKNALNYNIADIENHLDELEKFKDRDVYVYCSHSNRSRVVSQFLADTGFKSVTNVNGGISTWVLFDLICDDLYSTALPYKLYSPKVVRQILNEENTIVIDIRPRDEFDGVSSLVSRNIGRLKNAKNIPHNELEASLSQLDKNKKIILVDLDCSLTPKAASMLVNSGFKNIGIMVFGYNSWINEFPSGDNLLESAPQFTILNAAEVCSKITAGEKFIFLDIRQEDEFNSRSTIDHRNIGYLKNAVNIPSSDIEKRITELEKFKNNEIIVYEFGREGKAFETAKLLYERGFKCSVLAGGINSLVWRQKNLKNFCLPSGYIVK